MPREDRAPDLDDAERKLIEAAQRDPSRFADLYEDHFDRIYAYVSRRVRDRSEAEDLTAEVFQRALANLKHFAWRGTPFVAWLYRIAANAIADREKRQSAAPLPDLVDPAPPALAEIEEAERRARLFASVDQLPADQRRVIVLRFAHQKSIREIAEELERSEGAVKQLQFRALENLRAQMGDAHA
jgi:RNA polymerase sigma-70 factor (ECF subfamily)